LERSVTSRRVLLINPTMTARRHARFPLSLLSVAQALDGRHAVTVIDGNIQRDTATALRRAFEQGPFDAVGVTVMGGPQVRSAIDVSRAVRACAPGTAIVWGGYFPTLYPTAALNADYVDYAVRGQGETTFAELVGALDRERRPDVANIAGLSWRRGGDTVHNTDRPVAGQLGSILPSYRLLPDPRQYLARTVLGHRTAAHQAALGCRFRCTFCGVASMFRGATALPAAASLERDLLQLKNGFGADSIQFYDHNFFDREVEMLPILEVLARVQLPWWCYARSDALLNMSPEAWALVRKSRLRMAYIGAESPNDQLLRDVRKGTRADQTLEVAELCRRHGVIPELSFMVAPPQDPEGETERTFDFVRRIKRINPVAEIIVYVYTPPPPDCVPGKARLKVAPLYDIAGRPVVFPATPDEWTQPRWVDYACHADAPWLSARLRQRIRDFVTVLRCRFPTVQDVRTPRWAAVALRAAAAWRYRYRRYDRPWELSLAQRLVQPADPQATSL
jgi:anaerobic magnesium-protoporphyrin IX monomethyl ester cyclase